MTVLREPDGGKRADVQAVVLDLGLVGFESLGGLEDDRDFGPSLRIFVTATQAPATAATMGMIQTSESRVRFLATALDSGTWGLIYRCQAY